MKLNRQMLQAAGVVFGICLIGAVYLARTVWPIDVISGKTVIVGTCALSDGESVELVQVWSGDGYMTSVRHYSGSGVFHVAGDPDTSKVWNVSMELVSSSGFVRLRFKGNEWKYFYNSHSLSTGGRMHQPL